MSLENDIRKVLETSYKDAIKVYESINNYAIEIGVVDARTGERYKFQKEIKTTKSGIKQTKQKKVQDDGLNNAELMYIHENGSPKMKIPARPVLEYTINYAWNTLLDETLDRISDGCFNNHWNEKQVKDELLKCCKRLQNYAREMIYNNDGMLKRNALSTALAKGFNHPLFRTGQLARSIDCILVDKRNYTDK